MFPKLLYGTAWKAASSHRSPAIAPRRVTVSESLHADEGPSLPASVARPSRHQKTGSLGTATHPRANRASSSSSALG